MITIHDLEKLRGSRPAHMPVSILAQLIEVQGSDARIHPGAQGRSARKYTAGYTRGMQANFFHHTVSPGNPSDIPYLISGLGDGWVICDAFIPNFGGVDLLASGPTYTEGRGGPIGLIPPDGGNLVGNSLEIGNWGSRFSVYPKPQTDSVLHWAAASALLGSILWDWWDGPVTAARAIAHFEWAPGRKVDPQGISPWSLLGGMWNMNALRKDVEAQIKKLIALITPVAPPVLPPPKPPVEERKMYGVEMGPPISSPSNIWFAKFGVLGGDAEIKVVDPAAERTAGAIGVDLIVQAVAVEGNGWISSNGLTVVPLRQGHNSFVTLPALPVDDKGNLQLIFHQGAKCRLIIDRVNHRLPARP